MIDTTFRAEATGHQPPGWLNRMEQLLLVLGVALLLVYSAARIHGATSERFALWQFNVALAAAPDPSLKTGIDPGSVNFSLWSEKRIRAFKESLALAFNPPIAVLTIPKLRLTVPIFDGTDDLTLDRGVGRIEGTAGVGEDGNIGIAGHRDGFFRVLKDIAPGDLIEMNTPLEKDIYAVDRIDVVAPDEVSVLQARPVAGITLVTCYPFYFVGDAPRRYIVEASLKERSPRAQSNGSAVSTSQTQKEK